MFSIEKYEKIIFELSSLSCLIGSFNCHIKIDKLMSETNRLDPEKTQEKHAPRPGLHFYIYKYKAVLVISPHKN